MTDDAWIGTVRVARDLGSVEALFPPFVSSLLDLPYRLFNAIQVALMVCGWQDNLDDEEMPPRHMWLDSRRVREWLKRVKENRKLGVKGGSDYIDDPVENAGAKDLIVG